MSVTLLKMIDVEVPKIAKKPIVVYDTWQFGGWIKPLMIDTEHVSADFLETLGKQGVMISNKAELVNVSEVNDNAVAVQELNEILYSQFIEDGISKYDKATHTIVKCLLDNFTEIEFPDYSYFKGIYLFPVEFIEAFIFQNIKFTGEFNCPNLQTVGSYAFSYSVFNGVFNCQNVKEIGEQSFYYSQFTGDFNCPNVQAVGNYAFELSNFTGEFNCPNVQTVGSEAFRYSNFSGSLNLPVCTQIGDSAFVNSNFSGSLNLPACTHLWDSAFYNSNFDTITIGANATLGEYCIGAHSVQFINDYAANGKLAGTYVWDAGTNHWIYQ